MKQLICTINYEYLATLSGYTAQQSFNNCPRVCLNKPKDDATTLNAPLMSLKASYQEGGIDLTKKRIQAFLIGLGITY